jgi:hypothetical protein
MPERIGTLVLSSTPYVDAAARERRRHRPPIDAVDVAADGSHLTDLWGRRQRVYPTGRPDLLVRFVRDALRVVDPEAGHRAVATYEMEHRLPLVEARVVLIGHADDPYAFPELEPLTTALGGAETFVIEGGMVPLEYTAAEFAEIVVSVLTD